MKGSILKTTFLIGIIVSANGASAGNLQQIERPITPAGQMLNIEMVEKNFDDTQKDSDTAVNKRLVEISSANSHMNAEMGALQYKLEHNLRSMSNPGSVLQQINNVYSLGEKAFLLKAELDAHDNRSYFLLRQDDPQCAFLPAFIPGGQKINRIGMN